MDADGSNATSVVTRPNGGSAPSFSPDGTRIAFTTGPSNIAIVNADGTALTTIVLDAKEPTWSPDGTKVAFSTTEGGGRVAVVNADGTGRALLSPEFVSWRSPAWSPDGTRIAARQHDFNAPGELAIFVMDAD